MPTSRVPRHAHVTDLSAALAAESQRHPLGDLTRASAVLIATYRRGEPPSGPAVDSPLAASAYATYRMPATFAAVAAVLAAAGEERSVPAPRTLLDVGGGTGAALWASALTFPTLTAATVLDRSEPALRLGRRLAARSRLAAVRAATWTRSTLTPAVRLPRADLVTIAYVLAELAAGLRTSLLAAAAACATTVVVVEPGTPGGHRRVLAARALLVERGFRVVAPCPTGTVCPLAGGTDWCHFAVRLDRSPVHRRVKGGSLGYEDEKYAYLVATRGAASGPVEPMGRVVRRPRLRPGVVELEVCTPAGGVDRITVSRRHGERYRTARRTGWGDRWAT
jgi:ribosomal protein RSM22 (predicted rRNA methylase)